MKTLALSFFIGSSSFLQVTRTTVKSWISSKFGQIQPCTAELAALDHLKKSFPYLRNIQNILMMTSWLPGQRLLPFGLLVFNYQSMSCYSGGGGGGGGVGEVGVAFALMIWLQATFSANWNL